jgi:hypothetical protein
MTVAGSVPSCIAKNRAGPVCAAHPAALGVEADPVALQLDQPVGGLLAGFGDFHRPLLLFVCVAEMSRQRTFCNSRPILCAK